MNMLSRTNRARVTIAESINHDLVHHVKCSNMNQNRAVFNLLKVKRSKGLRGNMRLHTHV